MSEHKTPQTIAASNGIGIEHHPTERDHPSDKDARENEG